MSMEIIEVERGIPEAAKPIEERALTVLPEVKLIKVLDEPSKELANGWFITVNEALDQIGKVFDPLIEGAMETKRKAEANRKAIVTQKETFAAPWQDAKGYIVQQLTGYKILMDKKRAKEEERLRQEAITQEMERRRKEEEEKLAQAAALEAAGAKEEAENMMAEAEQVQQEPVRVFVSPASTPKVEVKGGSFRETWHAEVTDIKKLCLAIGQGRASTNYVRPHMPALNDRAVADRDQMRIDGVEAIKETGMAKGKR